MKMMPLIMLSCSRTLAMLGAVNCATRGEEKNKTKIASLLTGRHESGTRMSAECWSPSGAWCWHWSHSCRSRSWFAAGPQPAGWGTSGTLSSPLFSHVSHPSEKIHTRTTNWIMAASEICRSCQQCSPGSCKLCNPPSRAAVRSGIQPCSRKPLRPNGGWKPS